MTRKKIKVGKSIKFKMFNELSMKFYGETRCGVVLRKGDKGKVERDWVINENGREVGLSNNEIREVIN